MLGQHFMHRPARPYITGNSLSAVSNVKSLLLPKKGTLVSLRHVGPVGQRGAVVGPFANELNCAHLTGLQGIAGGSAMILLK